ncbi:MAG: CoA transferase [Acidimicrobiales bacterium]
MTDNILAGVRVLDVGVAVQGPKACQVLADFGADVIKVEIPGIGDTNRSVPNNPDDPRSAWFYALNRGKRSVTLDLRTEGGRKAMLKLAETADVMVSNFKIGTLEAWGLGYDAVSAINPRIVYACGSGYGPLGPDAEREATDLAAQAAGGLISTTGVDGGDPTPVGVAIADHESSQNLVIGILAALRVTERDGVGQRVDVSLVGSQIWAQAAEYTHYAMTGVVPGRANYGHPLLPGIYRIFETSDGWIAVVGVPRSLRPGFWRAVEREDLGDDPRFKPAIIPRADAADLFKDLVPIFLKRTTAEWTERLLAEGERFAPVLDYAQVAATEQVKVNGYLRPFEHPEWGSLAVPVTPLGFSQTPIEPAVTSPELGAHTLEVLIDAGFSEEDLEALRDQGAW